MCTYLIPCITKIVKKKSSDNQRASQVNVSRTDKLTYYQVSTSNKKILNNSASMAINVKIIAINVGEPLNEKNVLKEDDI